MTGPVRRAPKARTRTRALLTGLVTAAASAGLALTGAGSAHAATPLPTHVFAPYFEAYNGDSLSGLASSSGNKYLTMAFLQTASAGSCTPDWNGDSSTPVSQANFGADIDTIQAGGGNVIPSFGGYAADTTGTDIADSCTNVNSIAAAYESVITTYDVTRIDLDVEADSLSNSAGIDRRNKAVKQVQDWAAANGRTVQFSYTLPTTTHGLTTGSLGDGSGLPVLQNAVSNGVNLNVVNLMTFDYYDGATHNMATDTETAAQGLHDQLAQLYPNRTDAQLWNTIGVTEMPGVDDYGPAETFTTANATTVYNWAVSKGINTLSFWALQRDNGGCPGSSASDTCSGISQSTWQFSHTFEPFSGGGSTTPPPANDFSVALTPSSGSVAVGGSATSTVKTAVTAGSAQSVALSVSGAPAGVTAAVSPGSVTAGGSATLTVSASSSAVNGSYPLTVTGKAGSTTHTATYTLTVTGGASACTAQPWSSSAIYVGGDKVSYGGHTWQAKWWTTDEVPGTTGEWGVWQDLGPC
ncbi:chitinase [Actinacidiphila guanduensis]|jgi:hypothetical protein|uniref:chitinase n=1 Tax=Actinacidiphila guanduensis TaxID=310781 RepID=A0A1H0Q7E2_9ACTN|nr:glycosyl hydrolase family 18 protein [Actinacidiphila guanduensis]SDP13273.1 Glycosyl hydrolases family 18 [Actinacidiphila guanduensis]